MIKAAELERDNLIQMKRHVPIIDRIIAVLESNIAEVLRKVEK
jgi:hypothetical protein